MAGYGMPPMIGPGPPIQKGRNPVGPPGANVFIFHIPNEMTNVDLYNMFAHYGRVVSARIMVERETGRSRGFGCVTERAGLRAWACAMLPAADVTRPRDGLARTPPSTAQFCLV